MALVNENYLKLQGSYLFAEIAHRVQKFKAENPEAEVISLGEMSTCSGFPLIRSDIFSPKGETELR